MGIDKPDVRFVIHRSMPKSLEGCYQESGRAGRDGLNAICTIMYSYGDAQRIRKMIEGSSRKENGAAAQYFKRKPDVRRQHHEDVNAVVQYCENLVECRRNLMLGYFGEILGSAQCDDIRDTSCDNCSRKTQTNDVQIRIMDLTNEAIHIAKLVQERGKSALTEEKKRNLTVAQLADTFSSCSSKRNVNQKQMANQPAVTVSYSKKLIINMICRGFLEERVRTTGLYPVCYIYPGRHILRLLNGRMLEVQLRSQILI